MEAWPGQYNALPIWHTEDNIASIDTFSEIASYARTEVMRAEELLSLQAELEVDEVTDPERSHPLFWSWYLTGAAPTTTDARWQSDADPALVEAFHELKAAAQQQAKEANNVERRLVVRAHSSHLRGRNVAIVESEHHRENRTLKQTGLHTLLEKEKHGDGWLVLELHILLNCSMNNADYVALDFAQFLESIKWLDSR